MSRYVRLEQTWIWLNPLRRTCPSSTGAWDLLETCATNVLPCGFGRPSNASALSCTLGRNTIWAFCDEIGISSQDPIRHVVAATALLPKDSHPHVQSLQQSCSRRWADSAHDVRSADKLFHMLCQNCLDTHSSCSRGAVVRCCHMQRDFKESTASYGLELLRWRSPLMR